MNPLGAVLALPRTVRSSQLSVGQMAAMMAAANPFGLALQQTLRQDREEIPQHFLGLLNAYQGNAVVFGLELKRLQVFSQALFRFQELRNGVGGDLFWAPELEILEHPEPKVGTQGFLMRVLISADFGGTAFIVRRPNGRLKVLRPDWVTVILGSREETPDPVDIELLGIGYRHGGYAGSGEMKIFQADEVAVWSPIPDGTAFYRGIPWPLAAVREIQADAAATLHKLMFFENGATPNLIVTLDKSLTLDKAKEWIALFEQDHKGVLNAYRTVYLGGGAAQQVVGANLRQIDFKATQGAGETRIALVSGIHPSIAGLSEGLQGASLNAGNFTAARRIVADVTLHSMWGGLAQALQDIVPPPRNGSRLWYDHNIPFLADDVRDAAEVLSQKASAIRTLTDGGYTPESVVAAVTSGDLHRLVHTGLLSVQMLPPGEGGNATAETGRALIGQAEQRLLAAGVKPTQERIAEALDVSVRTVQRWQSGDGGEMSSSGGKMSSS